jgi:hypothetical protein
MQSGGRTLGVHPRRGYRPVPQALRAARRAGRGAGHHPPGHRRLDRYAALEFTVRVDRPGGRRSRRAHRVRHAPLLRPARPQLRTTPAPPHRGTLLPAPGYRPHTLPTKLVHYAMKEAAA